MYFRTGSKKCHDDDCPSQVDILKSGNFCQIVEIMVPCPPEADRQRLRKIFVRNLNNLVPWPSG